MVPKQDPARQMFEIMKLFWRLIGSYTGTIFKPQWSQNRTLPANFFEIMKLFWRLIESHTGTIFKSQWSLNRTLPAKLFEIIKLFWRLIESYTGTIFKPQWSLNRTLPAKFSEIMKLFRRLTEFHTGTFFQSTMVPKQDPARQSFWIFPTRVTYVMILRGSYGLFGSFWSPLGSLWGPFWRHFGVHFGDLAFFHFFEGPVKNHRGPLWFLMIFVKTDQALFRPFWTETLPKVAQKRPWTIKKSLF